MPPAAVPTKDPRRLVTARPHGVRGPVSHDRFGDDHIIHDHITHDQAGRPGQPGRDGRGEAVADAIARMPVA